MILIIIWLCSITVSQHVCGKVITVNNNTGSNNLDCCKDGLCPCSSFHQAFLHMENNTIIYITSQAVSLHNSTYSKSLYNVTITSYNGATVMCNNSGVVFCLYCNNITIEKITWDQCGNPANYELAGIFFIFPTTFL